MEFKWDLMGFKWDLNGIYWNLMEFNGILLTINTMGLMGI